MSFPKYPSTRRWGSNGIAEVPEHWVERRLRDVARVVNGFPFDSSLFTPDKGLPLVRIRDLGRDTTEMRYGGDIVTAALIDSTDVLIGMDGDFTVGRWLGSGQALLNQRVCCVRGRSPMVTRFVEYNLPRPLQAINDVTYSTTVKHLSSGQVEAIRIVMPPLDEEIASVVHFLDRETAKIDALIAEQERLIALLQEKRQAVISHAVTKGLDPNVPMKDSGFAHLGRIPAHWDVSRLRHLVESVEAGTSVNSTDVPALDRQLGVLKTSAVYGGKLRLSENKAVLPEEEPRATCPVQAHTLIVSRINTPEHVGVAGYSAFDAPNIFLPDRLWSVRFAAFSAEYAWRWTSTQAYRAQVEQACTGTSSSMQNISGADFLSFVAPVPPRDEQASIALFIRDKSAAIDSTLEAVATALRLLRERRTALITAAVTGQIDVRGLVETAA